MRGALTAIQAATVYERRRGGDGRSADGRGTYSIERMGSRTQRCTGGRHIVDDQHPFVGRTGVSAKGWAVEAMGTVETGLRTTASIAFEETAARDTELGRDAAGDHLGLVEPASAAAFGGGRRPGDDVDRREVEVARDEAVDEKPGEVMRQLTPVAVLEPQHHVARPPGEEHRGDHVTVRESLRRCDQRKPAGATQHRSCPPTPCTFTLKDHVPHSDKGVSQGFGESKASNQ